MQVHLDSGTTGTKRRAQAYLDNKGPNWDPQGTGRGRNEGEARVTQGIPGSKRGEPWDQEVEPGELGWNFPGNTLGSNGGRIMGDPTRGTWAGNLAGFPPRALRGFQHQGFEGGEARVPKGEKRRGNNPWGNRPGVIGLWRETPRGEKPWVPKPGGE